MKNDYRLKLPALAGAVLVFSPQIAFAARRRSSSSSDSPAWWIIVLLIVGVVAGLMGLMALLEKRRSGKIQEIATRLGLTFRRKPTDADNLLPSGCHVAEIGHGRIVSNVLEATRTAELSFTLFDYQYTIGHGKNSNTVYQTITRMQSNLFHLPAFLLFPETLLAKMGKMFGRADINFPDSPEFSRKYILRGDDEAAIRALFTPELRQTLERQDRLTIEGAGPLLFIFRKGRRLKPDQLPARIEQDKKIAALFFAGQPATTAAPPPLPQAG